MPPLDASSEALSRLQCLLVESRGLSPSNRHQRFLCDPSVGSTTWRLVVPGHGWYSTGVRYSVCSCQDFSTRFLPDFLSPLPLIKESDTTRSLWRPLSLSTTLTHIITYPYINHQVWTQPQIILKTGEVTTTSPPRMSILRSR